MAGLRGVDSRGTSKIFLIGIISCLVPRVWTYQRTLVSHCVPIREPLCQGNYNFTSFPNILGHEDHEEASARLAEFKPLIKNACSQHIKFFLCSLHFPMCDSKVPYGIPACREMCEDVRVNCEPYLKAFHLEWPETIRCSKLPFASSYRCLVPRSMARNHQERSRETLRDHIESSHYDDTPKRLIPRERGHRKRTNRKQNKRRKERKPNPSSPEIHPEPTIRDVVNEPRQLVEKVVPTTTTTTTTQLPDAPNQTSDTPKQPTDTPKQPPDTPETTAPNNHRWSPISIDNGLTSDQDPERHRDYYYDDTYNQFVATEDEKPKCKNEEKFTFVKKLNTCLPICDVDIDVMFSSRDKNFIYYWMMVCSILCFISSAFTVGTFLVDSKRFRYPERPIIFLSLCYLLYATAYLVRLGRGPTGSVSCVTMEESDVNHRVMGDLESTGCTAVFFLLYYFGMAAAAWWVVLSVTWFLAAGLKWGHEAIESNGFCFHLAAWLLPAVQTIVVLVLGKVDGDELTGLCYVGNLNKDSLLYFVIIPLMTYLGVGALALGAGFCSLLKIRRVMRKTGDDPVRLEKLILKIGIFTVLYIVPTSCVVAVNVYEYNNANHWTARAEARPCYPPGFLSDSVSPYQTGSSRYKPYYTQRYRDYTYDDTYMSQSPDYPSFAYRSYDERLYPDIHQTGYSPQAPGYDRRIQGAQHRRSRLRNGDYQQFRNGRYRPERALNRRRHQQRSVRSSERRLPFDPKLTDRINDENTNEGLISDRDCHLAESIPSFPIFAIKIFMSLLAGITSGIWVWSGKTYKSWKLFCESPWCGRAKSAKGSDLTVNTRQATSSGNLNAAPSVTSHLLPQSHSRPVPDGEYPCDNRFSFPVQSPDLYYGYHPVNQEEDDVTRHMMSPKIVTSRKTSALTLGDIAREYSDNLDSEMMHSPRTFHASPTRFDNITRDDVTFYKHSDNFKGTKKTQKDKGPSSVSNCKSKRAIPNNYVDSRAGRFRGEPANYVQGPYHPQRAPHERRRIRKYSEGDVNRLNLVSQSGIDPITSSTRRKAESAHVRCTQRT